MNVFGLFPIPVGVDDIDYRESIDFNKIKWNKLNYSEDKEIISRRSQVSRSYKVLDDYKDLKILIQKSIDSYIKEVLYLNREFQIVSSWFTKTERNCESTFHSHTNSRLSAVFYFNEPNLLEHD